MTDSEKLWKKSWKVMEFLRLKRVQTLFHSKACVKDFLSVQLNELFLIFPTSLIHGRNVKTEPLEVKNKIPQFPSCTDPRLNNVS